jgi:hypothetical protein
VYGLSANLVVQLANRWTDTGLWEDVMTLSQRFHAAAGEEERRLAWHHLVLAVGYFKRQPGRRLRPAPLHVSPEADAPQPATRAAFPTERGEGTVEAETPESWSGLQACLRGAATPTTTTLLAALWPSRHFIFDWRVKAAANGLRLQADLSALPSLDLTSSRMPTLTMADYAIVREWCLETTDELAISLTQLERALYELSRSVPASRGRTWQEYASVLTRVMASAA